MHLIDYFRNAALKDLARWRDRRQHQLRRQLGLLLHFRRAAIADAEVLLRNQQGWIQPVGPTSRWTEDLQLRNLLEVNALVDVQVAAPFRRVLLLVDALPGRHFDDLLAPFFSGPLYRVAQGVVGDGPIVASLTGFVDVHGLME